MRVQLLFAFSALSFACATGPGPRLPAPSSLSAEAWSTAQAESLSLLARLVHIDSSPESGSTGAAAQLLVDYLKEHDIAAQTVALGNNHAGVWARWSADKATKRPILLVANLDTPALTQGWPEGRGPLSAEISNDALWGRGTRGGKALAVTQVVVMATLKRAGITLDRDVLLFVSPDGASGTGRGLAVVAAEQLELTQACFALGPGMGLRRIFGTKKPVHLLTVAERGRASLDLVAAARADETQADPERAVRRLTRALEVIANARRAPRFGPASYAMLEGLSNDVFFLLRPAYRVPAFARLFLLNSAAEHSVVGKMVRDEVHAKSLSTSNDGRRARAVLEASVLPGTRPAELRNWLRQRVGDDSVHLTIRRATDASSSAFWPALLSAANEVDSYGATWAMETGATDLARLRELGVPAYGYSPFTESSETDRSKTGPGEHLELDELQLGLRRYERLMQYVLRLDEPAIAE